MILDETYRFLRSHYPTRLDAMTIAEVRIGLHLTAVKLSDGSVGVSSTLDDEQQHCLKANRDYDDFSPSRIRGRKVTGLFENPKQTAIIRTLKTAVLNAFSSAILSETRYRVIVDKDPIDLVDLGQKRTITLVGAFQSYIRKIAGTGNRLYVLEMNERSLADEHKMFYVPADEYQKVIPLSDIVIITGQTLVNDTLGGLLASIPPHARLIVTGPSSSLVPDVLFRYGVSIVGAIRVCDAAMLFTIAGEGGSGYHLFEYGCARKICILNENENPAS